MIVSKLVICLFAILCFLQMAYGLLYGLAPDHLLLRIQRLRFLQKQEEQRNKLLEVAEQQLLFEVSQLHKAVGSPQPDEAARELVTVPGRNKLGIVSSRLLTSLRNGLLRSNPSPSFKYSFVG